MESKYAVLIGWSIDSLNLLEYSTAIEAVASGVLRLEGRILRVVKS